MLRKQIGLLFLFKMLRIPLNLVVLSLTAKYYGVSIEKDIWLLSFTTMTVIDAALWGPINETFRTKFVYIKEKDSIYKAISQTQSLLTYFIAFSLLLMIIIMIFPNCVVSLIAPEYGIQAKGLVEQMLLVVAPVLVLNQLMQIGISILNAYEIFFIAELSGFFSTIINIILLYTLSDRIGISALPASYYIATGLTIFLIIFFIIKKDIPLFKYKWNFKFYGFQTFFLFALPFFLPYFFGQINGLIEKILASKLGNGTISILDFSNKIPTMMYGIIINVITTLLIPILSRYYIRNDVANYNNEFKKFFNLGIIGVGLIISIVCASSSSITHFLYDKGTISPSSLKKIIDLSIFYGFSIFGLYIYVIFGMSLLSSEKHKHYALLGMMTQLCVILVNTIFVRFLSTYTFPLSILFSHLFFGWLMFKKYPFRNSLHLEVKYFAFMFLLVLISYFLISKIFLPNIYLLFSVQILAISLLAIVLAYLFDLDEKKLLVELLREKLLK